MSQYNFGTMTVQPDGTICLPIIDSAGDVADLPCFDQTQLASMMVELVATYDVTPVRLTEIIPSNLISVLANFPSQLPGVKLYYDEERNAEQFIAEAKNGDTGHAEQGFGLTGVQAVADIARSHGFKSQLTTGGGLTIAQWFTDFAYGFTRMSDELLAAEMDAMFAPEKGAW